LERGDPLAAPLLPPLIAPHGRTSAILGYPGGRSARSVIRDAFESPRTRLWREALERIARFAAGRKGWARLIRPENGRIHGHVSRTLCAVCLLRPEADARQTAEILLRNHLAALALLLRRLDRDFGGPRRVVDVELQAGDPHRGGQSVAKITLRAGAVFAYKARSVDVEGILFGRGWGSAAEAVNRFLRAEATPARLPLLEVKRGSGRDGRHYGYIGWIDSGEFLRPMRRRGFTVRPIRISEAAARPLWRDAGLFAAFSYAVGVADLHHDNLAVGRGRDGGVRYHPIDAEFVGVRVRDLEATLLVRGTIRQTRNGHLHSGFESEVLLCGREADTWGFARRGSRWVLARIRGGVPEQNPALVVDRRGRVGYRAYLAEFLDGLLRGYSLLCRRQETIRRLLRRRLAGARLRYLSRSTEEYGKEMIRRQFGGSQRGLPRYRPSELRQLENLDVPYYFRRGGGPILYYETYPFRTRRSGPLPRKPDAARGLGGRGPLQTADFATLLQDALDHVADAKSALRVRGGGIHVDRRRGAAGARFEGEAGGKVWKVRIDSRQGVADVETLDRLGVGRAP